MVNKVTHRRPKVTANANFSMSWGWASMHQYPLAKLRVEKTFVWANLTKRLSILRKGTASVFVMAFYFLKSTHKRVFFCPSHLYTKVTGEEYGE